MCPCRFLPSLTVMHRVCVCPLSDSLPLSLLPFPPPSLRCHTDVVSAGDNGILEYSSTTALTANGATITDNVGNDLLAAVPTITLPNVWSASSLSAGKTIQIVTDY